MPPWLAAQAVRALPLVEAIIPKNPANIDDRAPVRKRTAVCQLMPTASRMNTTATEDREGGVLALEKGHRAARM